MDEVHRWRGTPEQRAQRSLSVKTGQFAYFDRQLGFPGWKGKRVLDFGGNEGNLLVGSEIEEENYYCVDVLAEALEEGRSRWPRAHWIHYDRYNCSFNPGGVPKLPVPNIGVRFDLVLAYSVFTHTTREDMHELVRQLKEQLAPGGLLAFTFEDPRYEAAPGMDNLRRRLAKAGAVDETLLERARGAQWCAVIDSKELHLDGNGNWNGNADACMTYDVFYTADFLRREFPEALVRPPVNGEIQHCCIMRRDA